jgi:hypothetical protein
VSGFSTVPNDFGLDRWLVDHHSRGVPDPDAEPSAEPDTEALMELFERAINGVELPDYAGVPDSGAPAASQPRRGCPVQTMSEVRAGAPRRRPVWA